LLVMGILLYWRLPSKRINTDNVKDVWDFASFCLYDRAFTRRRFLTAMLVGYPLPRDWRQTVRLLAFAVAWAVTAGGVMGTLWWWADRWHWEWYRSFHSFGAIRGYPLTMIAVRLAVGAAAVVVFFRTEYAEANHRSQQTSRR